MAALAERQPLDLEVAASSCVIAAILVELKSRACCPAPTRSTRRGALGLRGARPAFSLDCSSSRRTPPPPTPSPLLIERRAAVVPRVAGLEERFRDPAPDLLPASRPSAGRRLPVGVAPQAAAASSTCRHVTVEQVTVAEAVAELEACLPGRRRHQLPRPHRALHDPHAGDRALPRPPRAVQAGLVTSTKGTPSATCIVTWIGGPGGAEPGGGGARGRGI